jgi:type IV secretion system protein VirB5
MRAELIQQGGNVNIRIFIRTGLLAFAFMLAAMPARAGIPVFDGTSIAQQIQQVAAWDQQYGQMAESLGKLQQQYQQLQSMTSKLDGGRGLGSIQNDPGIQSILPNEIRNPASLLTNPSSFSTSATNISSIQAAFGVGTTVDSSAGASAADGLGRAQSILVSSQLRETQLKALASRVDTAPDAKASMDLLNRNTLEAASINNQLIQTMAALEAAKRAEELRATARHQQFAAGARAGAAAPIVHFKY